ncbi:MAG: hypothetical protein KKH98_06650, partial [Spirochaetes bacterium]|nr:hypothetical protein [Spirochaetota bacterium]
YLIRSLWIILTSTLLFNSVYAGKIKYPEPVFQDRPSTFFPLSPLPGHFIRNEEKSAVREYMERPHFRQMMTEKEEKVYHKEYLNLLQNKDFLNRYSLKRDKRGSLSGEAQEFAAFSMGQYFFSKWSKFHLGLLFQTPYRTMYKAEQSFRYYLKKHPDGKFTAPVLFSIAQCRIHQKDYFEAYVAYRYAFRILLENNGLTNMSIIDLCAHEVLNYAKKYEDKLNINIKFSTIGAEDHIDTRFEFDQNDKTINVYIGLFKYFNSHTTGSSN